MMHIIYSSYCYYCCLIYLLIVNQGFARPQNSNAKLINYEQEQNLDNYYFSYDIDNGIKRSETGVTEESDNGPVLVVQGSYEFTDPKGVTYSVTFVSDENGYHPKVKFGTAFAKPETEAILGVRISSNVQATLVGGGLG